MTSTRRHPLLGPWWITAHVIVAAVLVTFPQLALWQWDRYQQESDQAARMEARRSADPVPLADVVSREMDRDAIAAAEFTPVVVTGTWSADEQVAQRNRSYDGQAGFDLLTPLVLDDAALDGGVLDGDVLDGDVVDGDVVNDHTAVLVRRGWVPPERVAGATPTTDVPVSGEVEVTGWLEISGEQPSFGPTDAGTGMLDIVFHADVERLDTQVQAHLLPMIVRLTSQVPDDGQFPLPQAPPPSNAEQNLSYMLQWSAFTLIVAIGYGIVVWRRLSDHRAGIDSDVDPLLRDPGSPSHPDVGHGPTSGRHPSRGSSQAPGPDPRTGTQP